MNFISLHKVSLTTLFLASMMSSYQAWGESFILPPNEQVAMNGNSSQASKQICQLELRGDVKTEEYQTSKIVTFLAVKNTITINGLVLPQGTLMTFVTTDSLKNDLLFEFEPSAQLEIYNDSDFFLNLHCNS